MRYTIDLQLRSKLVGSGTETSTKAETPIEDYPTEVDYDDLGCHNEMEDINDFDSDGNNKFDVCQDTEDAYEINMDEPQGFELSNNMAEIYTPTIFSNFFQPKLMEAINLTCEVQEEEEVVCTFSLKEYGVCHRAHMVALRNTEEKATCSCHLYPFCNDLFRNCNILSVNGAMSIGLYEYAKMVLDEVCYVIQASSTHSSPAYIGSPCVTPILFVVSNPHVT
ncbi:hypothetical protein AMTRI_Chr10g5320 [Amborella trichopoda]